jgi:hypothetical protein
MKWSQMNKMLTVLAAAVVALGFAAGIASSDPDDDGGLLPDRCFNNQPCDTWPGDDSPNLHMTYCPDDGTWNHVYHACPSIIAGPYS